MGNNDAGHHRQMTSEQRLRVGAVVAQRIADRSTSFRAVTLSAGIDPKTLRSLINGERWPTAGVRVRIEAALDWPPGEIMRIANGWKTATEGSASLSEYSSTALLAELLHRAVEYEKPQRVSTNSVPEPNHDDPEFLFEARAVSLLDASGVSSSKDGNVSLEGLTICGS